MIAFSLPMVLGLNKNHTHIEEDVMVGTTISHYKVLEEIGQGGIHTVIYDFDIASD